MEAIENNDSEVQSNDDVENNSVQRYVTSRDLVVEKDKKLITDSLEQVHIISVCNNCHSVYLNRTSLSYHIRSVHKGVRYNCNKCDSKFTQQSNLTIHMKSVHGGVKFDCNQCDYRATQQGSLTTHKKSVHESIFTGVNIL